MRYFIGNWKMFGVPKSVNILNKINSFHSKDKNRNKYRVIITLYLFRFLSFKLNELILFNIFKDFGVPNIFQFPIKYLIICLSLKFDL